MIEEAGTMISSFYTYFKGGGIMKEQNIENKKMALFLKILNELKNVELQEEFLKGFQGHLNIEYLQGFKDALELINRNKAYKEVF